MSFAKYERIGCKSLQHKGSHYLKNKGLEKGTYVRVGSSNRLADPALIAEL